MLFYTISIAAIKRRAGNFPAHKNQTSLIIMDTGVANTMTVNVLATQGARASAAMVLVREVNGIRWVHTKKC